jgi:hypothetical protein
MVPTHQLPSSKNEDEPLMNLSLPSEAFIGCGWLPGSG